MEVDKELGVEIDEHRNFLDRYSHVQVASLEARFELIGSPGAELQTTDRGFPTTYLSRLNFRGCVSISSRPYSFLRSANGWVAAFSFYEGLTLKEIDKALNLAQDM